MLLKEFIQSSRTSLSALYDPQEAAAMVTLLCKECLGVESYTYMVDPSYEIKDKQLAVLTPLMERLCLGEPLQYVLGYTEFYGKRFNVSRSVLIPRPETELMCRKAIELAMMLYRKRKAFGSDAAPVRILDLCTGSGCIAWTLAANVPGARVVAVDISKDALQVAQGQAVDLPKGSEPVFCHADIFDEAAMERVTAGQEAFDIIISNPPYVLESERAQMRTNVLGYEPELALFVPDDQSQKFNAGIADICVRKLNTEGTCFVEINETLGGAVKALLVEKGFKNVEIIKDLAHKDRFVKFNK